MSASARIDINSTQGAIDETALANAIAVAVGRSMDLEVVCDATTGDRIFVRMETDDAGVSTYTNPVTGAVVVPGTDFVPCGPLACTLIGPQGLITNWATLP